MSISQFTPLKTLNQFSTDWRIKVRVCRKPAIRRWSNQTSEGQILSLNLIDHAGTQMTASFFNDAAEKFNKELFEGRVYCLAGGNVKLSNKRYTSVPHEFQLTFDINADVSQLPEEATIPQAYTAFTFTQIKKITQVQPKFTIDVLGRICRLDEAVST
jgi:replication factor A1